MALTARRSGGMFPPTDRPEVRVIEVAFGAVNHPRIGAHGKARLWLLAPPDGNGADPSAPTDPDSPVGSELAVYLPGPTPPGYGRGGISNDFPVRRSVGEIASAEIHQARRWNVQMADGTRLTAVIAPCGCGAGRLAQAGPVDTPYRIMMIRPPAWVHRYY